MEPISDWKGCLVGGRYRLYDLINPDATMSCVYKAVDEQRGGWVVVKMAPKSDGSAARLRREAVALERLMHPRIVRYLDKGVFDSFFFLVLECLPGPDLDMVIECPEYRLSQEFAIIYTLQILEGLEVMHQSGMVHRDLKPANVMVAPDGVKIIDLGLVRLTSRPGPRRRRLTKPLQGMGTLSYLSPEQKQGIPVDGRSDLYACGIVLYELLTRAKPFYGRETLEWKQWLKSHSKSPWFHPGPLRPFPTLLRVPQAVQEVVWKALAVDPKDRYQTVEEMRLALLAARPFSLWWWVKGMGGKIRSAWRAVWS